jgi:excisionase family DNA binding protein
MLALWSPRIETLSFAERFPQGALHRGSLSTALLFRRWTFDRIAECVGSCVRVQVMNGSRTLVGGIDDELLTVGEAAGLVKKTAQTVRGWIHQGRIPYEVTPGGQYLVWRSGLLESRSGRAAKVVTPSWQQEIVARRAASRVSAKAAAQAIG